MKPKSSAKLSNNVLQMKFMKKTAIQEQEILALEEQKKLIDDEHWYLKIEEKKGIDSNVGTVIIEPSYTVFDGLIFGRFSFNGFNPQVEKLMNPKDESKVSDDEEKEIDDDEMAEKYKENSVGLTINKKFENGKRFGGNGRHKVKRLGHKSN